MKKLVLCVSAAMLLATAVQAAEQARPDELEAGPPVTTQTTAVTPEAETVHWSVVASGGGPSNLGGMTLRATLGQPVVGRVSLGNSQMLIGYWQDFHSGGCCNGRVGDVNGVGGDEPTIGDVSYLIDALFISVDLSMLDCLTEADVNQSGGPEPQPSDITIGDVILLIDRLFITVDLSLLHNCL